MGSVVEARLTLYQYPIARLLCRYFVCASPLQPIHDQLGKGTLICKDVIGRVEYSFLRRRLANELQSKLYPK